MSTQRQLAIVAFGVMLLPLLVAGGLTYPKLQKMHMIRGDAPGATRTTVVITDKWQSDTAYWVAWNNADVQRRSNERVNMQRDKWQALEVGSELEVAYLPGDNKPYLRDGIFVSDGNFAFDKMLLVAELVAAGIFLITGLVLLLLPGRKQPPHRFPHSRNPQFPHQ